MSARDNVKEFLSSRRARITPEQAGLPAYGGNRRVPGLRREEVAILAGVSVDYYVRMERGNLFPTRFLAPLRPRFNWTRPGATRTIGLLPI